MKYHVFIFFLVGVTFFNCETQKELTLDDVLANYHEKVETIDKLSYNIRRVDTFAQGGAVWDNKGFAYLEKKRDDSIFGFSFYGKRDDVPIISIYDQAKTFTLNQNEMTYELGKGGLYYMGSPGGQMVSISFFSLDSIFESSQLIQSGDNYVIKYTFPDDTTYMVTNREKYIEFNSDFIPIKIKTSAQSYGEKSTSDIFITDVKINENSKHSIDKYKALIKDYTLLKPEGYIPSGLIGKELPISTLSEIMSGNNVSIDNSKVVLLDFWEIWCGWCIKAFPKVEELQKKYSEDLMVYGICTQDKEKAISLIEKKKVTFKNFFEESSIHELFKIKSFPTYYLVDKKGVIVNEYFGFTDDIENDIKNLINESK